MVGQATAVSDLYANPSVRVADHSAALKRFRPGAQPQRPLASPFGG